jgi:hypothetical protein
MPYKRIGKKIYHKKQGRWKLKQTCKSVANAKKAMRFLSGLEHGMKPKKRREHSKKDFW